MLELNKNEQLRDEIIFGKYNGSVAKFENLNLDRLRKLFELNFINPNDKQNDCPTADEILQFMEKYPEFALFEKADDFVVANEVYCWFD